MKELKSKKTGLVQILSEEDYARLVKEGTVPLSRFVVTDLRSRPLIPSSKVPSDLKNKTKK